MTVTGGSDSDRPLWEHSHLPISTGAAATLKQWQTDEGIAKKITQNVIQNTCSQHDTTHGEYQVFLYLYCHECHQQLGDKESIS